jgi:hypothetical protein
MSVFVCMYVCVYVYVCIYVCMYVCAFVHVCVCDGKIQGLLIGSLPGQAPLIVTSGTITISAQRSSPSALGNATLAFPGSSSGVGLPSSLMSNVFGGNVSAAPTILDSSLVSYAQNLYAFAENNSATTAPIVSFSLSANGSPVIVSNLSTPILITISRSAGLGKGYISACRYWNVAKQAWASDGCVSASSSPNVTVCACTHLTAFNLKDVLLPKLNTINVQDILAAFNWKNIVDHPTPVITMALLGLTWVCLSILLNASDKQGSCPCCVPRRQVTTDRAATIGGFHAAQALSEDEVDVDFSELDVLERQMSAPGSALPRIIHTDMMTPVPALPVDGIVDDDDFEQEGVCVRTCDRDRHEFYMSVLGAMDYLDEQVAKAMKEKNKVQASAEVTFEEATPLALTHMADSPCETLHTNQVNAVVEPEKWYLDYTWFEVALASWWKVSLLSHMVRIQTGMTIIIFESLHILRCCIFEFQPPVLEYLFPQSAGPVFKPTTARRCFRYLHECFNFLIAPISLNF